MNSDQIRQVIERGDFIVAKKLFSHLSEAEIRCILTEIGYDDNNFCAYAFALFLLSMCDDIISHQRAGLVIDMDLPYLVGAYAAAAYHARRVFSLVQADDPTDDGGLFSIFHYPTTPLRAAEIVPIAKKILEYDPQDAGALRALEDAQRPEDPLEEARNEYEHLVQFILAGKFTQAKELSAGVNKRELYALLLYLGCEEGNVCAYAFTWFLMQNKEEAELHYLAYRIVTQAFATNDLRGCDAVGLFHLRRAIVLEPDNEKYMNHFLLLHTPHLGPTHLISDEEAETIPKRALDRHRFNVVAAKVLEKLVKYDSKYD